MNTDGPACSRVERKGRTTCGYFFDDDRRIFYATTHTPGRVPRGPTIPKGTCGAHDTTSMLRTPTAAGLGHTNNPRYEPKDALPDGKTIVFTSLRDGDLGHLTMNVDGTHLKRPNANPRLRRRSLLFATANRSFIAPGIRNGR